MGRFKTMITSTNKGTNTNDQGTVLFSESKEKQNVTNCSYRGRQTRNLIYNYNRTFRTAFVG